MLPKTNTTLGQWISATNKVLLQHNLDFQLSIKKNSENYTFDQVFINLKKQLVDKKYRLGTVHSVKGETFEATLLILKTKGVGKSYKTILEENTNTTDSEELRIAYVGMTRPRKILVIAVPNEAHKIVWENKLKKVN